MITSNQASIDWWKKAMDEVGLECMDKMISVQADWDEILRTGQNDLANAIEITGMHCGQDRIAVEVGCGVGRMTAALAKQFGRVVGLDVAPKFILEACNRNTNDNVIFEVSDGSHLKPVSVSRCDTVFSYEVFYYLAAESLLNNFRDAFDLLESNGQFVFHLNMEPIHLKTRISYLWRQSLYACGIERWRGWPTGPGLMRHYHSPEWVRQQLTSIGFRVEKIAGPTLRQKWVVAIKP